MRYTIMNEPGGGTENGGLVLQLHILRKSAPSSIKRASLPFLKAEKLRKTPARWSVGKGWQYKGSQSAGASRASALLAA